MAAPFQSLLPRYKVVVMLVAAGSTLSDRLFVPL
jgi:hypothetical protein